MTHNKQEQGDHVQLEETPNRPRACRLNTFLVVNTYHFIKFYYLYIEVK